MSLQLRTAQTLIAEIEATLAELEEAETLLQRTKSGKAFIGFAGGIYIEVSRDEALEYIEKRKRSLRALLEKLRQEASKSKQ